MSKRRSKKKARELRDKELEYQELNKKGIKPKISRQERKRRMRMSKTERFIERLKNRGGYKYCEICKTSLDKCKCEKS
jgi:cupin superfamily acireductone dioxygenase involved in methionine salvage